jgi:hypothetical protein
MPVPTFDLADETGGLEAFHRVVGSMPSPVEDALDVGDGHLCDRRISGPVF